MNKNNNNLDIDNMQDDITRDELDPQTKRDLDIMIIGGTILLIAQMLQNIFLGI